MDFTEEQVKNLEDVFRQNLPPDKDSLTLTEFKKLMPSKNVKTFENLIHFWWRYFYIFICICIHITHIIRVWKVSFNLSPGILRGASFQDIWSRWEWRHFVGRVYWYDVSICWKGSSGKNIISLQSLWYWWYVQTQYLSKMIIH